MLRCTSPGAGISKRDYESDDHCQSGCHGAPPLPVRIYHLFDDTLAGGIKTDPGKRLKHGQHLVRIVKDANVRTGSSRIIFGYAVEAELRCCFKGIASSADQGQ